MFVRRVCSLIRLIVYVLDVREFVVAWRLLSLLAGCFARLFGSDHRR